MLNRSIYTSTGKEAQTMASTEIENLDPTATVEKVKSIAAGRALNRRNFLAAFGMTGVAAGAGLMSGCNANTTPVPLTAASPAETNVLVFALNLKYLEDARGFLLDDGTGDIHPVQHDDQVH